MKETKKTMKHIAHQSLKGKQIIVRCDFNVPIIQGKIASDVRIQKSLPTIYYLLKHQAKILLISHLGQPSGKVCESLRLQIVYDYLKQKWPISYFPADFRSEEVQRGLQNQGLASIFMLENIRFYAEEQKETFDVKQEKFCRDLCKNTDFYINEAFSVSHRNHASIIHLPKILQRNAMGLLFAREMNYLRGHLMQPKHPFVAIIGGAKISTKLPLLLQLLPKVDYLLLGGEMVFTFLKALGYSVGKSKWEDSYLESAKKILRKFGNKIILPVDFKASDYLSFPDIGKIHSCPTEKIAATDYCVDIGTESCVIFKKFIQKARLILWNGPMGIFENSKSAQGTQAVAEMLASHASHNQNRTTSIVGGGDSVSAIVNAGLEKKITHMSTGGGAALDLMANGSLPGHDALSTTPASL